jgi:hypothetical protein
MTHSNIRETKIFQVNESIDILCRWIKTSYGFKHEAEYRIGGFTRGTTKACYYNRTWESYEYQRVIKDALRKFSGFSEDQQKRIDAAFQHNATEELNKTFGMISTIASLGNILCDSLKEKNDWKARMLKAGIGGLDIPADWDTLSEEEKETRLNRVIEFAQQPVK